MWLASVESVKCLTSDVRSGVDHERTRGGIDETAGTRRLRFVGHAPQMRDLGGESPRYRVGALDREHVKYPSYELAHCSHFAAARLAG